MSTRNTLRVLLSQRRKGAKVVVEGEHPRKVGDGVSLIFSCLRIGIIFQVYFLLATFLKICYVYMQTNPQQSCYWYV